MNSNQIELVKYRLEQAERTLHQAEILAEYSEWNGVFIFFFKIFITGDSLTAFKNPAFTQDGRHQDNYHLRQKRQLLKIFPVHALKK